MKFNTKPAFHSNWKVGDLAIPYSKILAVFGEPQKLRGDEGDGKVSIEWSILFEDGTYATIHDRKEYSTPEELIARDHAEWSIGGTSKMAVTRIQDAILEHQKLPPLGAGPLEPEKVPKGWDKIESGHEVVSYKPEVSTDHSGKWYGNNLAFATREEAQANVESLAMRWTSVRDWRVVESNQPVNYKWVDGRLEPV